MILPNESKSLNSQKITKKDLDEGLLENIKEIFYIKKKLLNKLSLKDLLVNTECINSFKISLVEKESIEKKESDEIFEKNKDQINVNVNVEFGEKNLAKLKSVLWTKQNQEIIDFYLPLSRLNSNVFINIKNNEEDDYLFEEYYIKCEIVKNKFNQNTESKLAYGILQQSFICGYITKTKIYKNNKKIFVEEEYDEEIKKEFFISKNKIHF